ncbi:MAG: hypothetical protein AAFR93_01460 [Pseudomonadota bacterium]
MTLSREQTDKLSELQSQTAAWMIAMVVSTCGAAAVVFFFAWPILFAEDQGFGLLSGIKILGLFVLFSILYPVIGVLVGQAFLQWTQGTKYVAETVPDELLNEARRIEFWKGAAFWPVLLVVTVLITPTIVASRLIDHQLKRRT